MSIIVALDELGNKLDEFAWGYLITVRDDGRAQAVAVPTRYADGVLTASVGKGTAANLTARPNITLVFPGSTGEAMSLIVDGDAHTEGEHVEITPTWAVLHRAALGRG